jgi:hypothetical protein
MPLMPMTRSSTELAERVAQLVAGKGSVGEQMTQPRIEPAHEGDHAEGSVAVLDVGSMHAQADQMAVGVGDDVALAALHLLAGIGPPLSVVLTDWLSMTPALGLASRPCLSRDAMTNAWLMRSQIPSRDHR